MIWIQLLLVSHLVSAEVAPDQNARIEKQTELIMSTKVGKAICRYILGADAPAIKYHIGVSMPAALRIAANCKDAETIPWIYPSAANIDEVRKLTSRTSKSRKYEFLTAKNDFPVESWTDPFSNTTVLVTDQNGAISDERLTQLLAHELAVYFDAKATPAHPDAQQIPLLKKENLNVKSNATLNPLIAVTNPLNAHTLTYLRALQVELKIVRELVQREKDLKGSGIAAPDDMQETYVQFLDSDKCTFKCILGVVVDMRQSYYDHALPLIAFSPHYRDLMTVEIRDNLQNNLDADQKSRARDTFNVFPWQFLGQGSRENPIRDISSIFVEDHSTDPHFKTVSDFMRYDLWRFELPALSQTTVYGDVPLLEFMKVPLLSGYNILMSSGPRVRIRTGNVEGFFDELLF